MRPRRSRPARESVTPAGYQRTPHEDCFAMKTRFSPVLWVLLLALALFGLSWSQAPSAYAAADDDEAAAEETDEAPPEKGAAKGGGQTAASEPETKNSLM